MPAPAGGCLGPGGGAQSLMRASESSIEANPPETNPAEANPQGATTPASKIAPLLRLAGELGVAVGPILRELGLGARVAELRAAGTVA